MTTSDAIARSLPPDESGDRLTVRQVGPGELRRAVGLLLTGRTGDADAPGTEAFLHYVRDNNIDINRLHVALLGSRMVAAALMVPGAGRTAMVFVSPLDAPDRREATSAAVMQAAGQLDPQQVRIAQVLLDPGQELEAQALIAVGFRKLAHLIYMHRTVEVDEPAARPLMLKPPMQALNWTPTREEQFARAILASYEQTRDCPGLLGLRRIEDIMAGHRATGEFRPELWTALYQDDQPVAVMLLGGMPHRKALELVYLGVSVPYRNQGLARRLVEHAIHLTGESGATRLLLAVDEHNTPALKLYRSLQFHPTARRTALIMPLGDA